MTINDQNWEEYSRKVDLMPHFILDHNFPCDSGQVLIDSYEKRLGVAVFDFETSIKDPSIEKPGKNGEIPDWLVRTRKAWWKVYCYDGRDVDSQFDQFGLEFINGGDYYWFYRGSCDVLLENIDNMLWTEIMENMRGLRYMNPEDRSACWWQENRKKWFDLAQLFGSTTLYMFCHDPNQELRAEISKGKFMPDLVKENKHGMIPVYFSDIDNFVYDESLCQQYLIIDDFDDLKKESHPE